MNVALAGFYSRVQRPGRPAWGRPVGPPEWRRVIHVEALALSNVGRWIPVGGDGTWVDGSGSDYLLEPVGSWLRLAVACARPASLGEAGRPPSGPSQPLGLSRLCSALVPSLGKWVAEIYLILGCFVDLWMDVEAFRCIQLNQSPTLDSKPYECVSWPLD